MHDELVELPYLQQSQQRCSCPDEVIACMLTCDVTQALEHGVNEADSSEEDEGEPGEPTYVQEQQDLKRNFLQVCHHTPYR